MTLCGIYQIRNTVNGHQYIGQSVDLALRWSQHKWDMRHAGNHNPHLWAAWQKYGEAAFIFEALAVLAQPVTKRELTDLEQDYVDFFRPAYNIRRECVESQRGTRRSAEDCAKMSAARRGKPGHIQTPDAIAKAAAANRGKKRTPAQRARMSEADKGRRLSGEHRAKIGDAIRGKRRSSETRARMSAGQRRRAPPSPETRAKISAALKGRPLSSETRAKMSAAWRDKPWTAARRNASRRAHGD